MLKHFGPVCSVLIAMVLTAILILCLGDYIEQLPWVFAYFSNPKFHFILGAIAALIWFALRKNKALCMLAISVIAINVYSIAPYLTASFEKRPVLNNNPSISILHLNTNKGI